MSVNKKLLELERELLNKTIMVDKEIVNSDFKTLVKNKEFVKVNNVCATCINDVKFVIRLTLARFNNEDAEIIDYRDLKIDEFLKHCKSQYMAI